ncbi:MAG TPA: molybdate ABC transporter substrate-binding protein [Gaiellaceae bacterium]|nr:molybdate ABC transporter substrate-binding protein [Gaiellaceae bacterium]
MRSTFTGLVLALAALAALPASEASARSRAQVTVFAAASLTDVFPALDGAQRYSFGGSNALATQIANGAPADVFASANTTIPAQLYAKGLVEKPVSFTRNALVIVVPKSNPASIHTVYDLAKPGVKVDVASSAVPVGSYTLQVLKKLNLTAKITPNVVSRETDVREVLAKVALGQADAGFVYSTDARSVPGKVTVIKMPARAQAKITYAVAVVSRSAHKTAAQAFIRRVLSKSGQATMLRYGFLPLAKPAEKKPPKIKHPKKKP